MQILCVQSLSGVLLTLGKLGGSWGGDEGGRGMKRRAGPGILCMGELPLCSPGLTLLFSPGNAGGAGCGEGAVPGVQAARGEGSDILGVHAVSPG